MKRIGANPMVGDAGRRTAPWQSLTYHVTSSVQAEGCHFFLVRKDGSMTVTGYCVIDGCEHRVEEPKPISPETVEAIEALDLDKAARERRKLFSMADGTQKTVILGYADGKQRRIRLSPQQHGALKQLLQRELVGL